MRILKNNDYCATAVITDKFICVNTQSGHGLLTIDSSFSSYVLSLDTDNKTLGEVILSALHNSNTLLNNKEYYKRFNPDILKKECDEWISSLKIDYGYRSKK